MDASDATRVMQSINASYAVLADPAQRAGHDAWIRSQEELLSTRRAAAAARAASYRPPPHASPAAPPPPFQAARAAQWSAGAAGPAPDTPAPTPVHARQPVHQCRPWPRRAAAWGLGATVAGAAALALPPDWTPWHDRAPAAPPVDAQSAAQTPARQRQHTQYQRIAAVHPDARAIVSSQDFIAWSRQRGPARQQEVTRVMHSGSPDEVIALLTEYKQRTRRCIPPPRQPL